MFFGDEIDEIFFFLNVCLGDEIYEQILAGDEMGFNEFFDDEKDE